MEEFTEYVGIVGRPIGVDGTFAIADSPSIPYDIQEGHLVALGFSRGFLQTFTVQSYVGQGTHRRMVLREIRSDADLLVHADKAIYAHLTALDSSEADRYRIGDLLGCGVFDTAGTLLGVISDVWLLPANDVWEVTTASGETFPIPVIEDVVRNVDISDRRITVTLMDGLTSLHVHNPDDIDT